MLSILLLGLLVGLQHAMEADHLAAMASLATRSANVSHAARQGAIWGLGHTLTLFIVGGMFLTLEGLVPDQLAAGLETAVGLMLILLGADVLRRVWRERVHFHAHAHGEQRHFHAHSHARGGRHAKDPHNHRHVKPLALRSLVVGIVHGMAGSAALVVLALGSVESMATGLTYILVFGLGSVVGMAILGAAISLPLRWSAGTMTWAHNGLKIAVGIVTAALGLAILVQSGASLILA